MQCRLVLAAVKIARERRGATRRVSWGFSQPARENEGFVLLCFHVRAPLTAMDIAAYCRTTLPGYQSDTANFPTAV